MSGGCSEVDGGGVTGGFCDPAQLLGTMITPIFDGFPVGLRTSLIRPWPQVDVAAYTVFVCNHTT